MKLTCEECGHNAEPVEIAEKALMCNKCRHPFGYFAASKYFNNKKKARLEKERNEHNKNLVRGLKK